MQEDVLQSLLQQGMAEFPTVQFSLSRPQMELKIRDASPSRSTRP